MRAAWSRRLVPPAGVVALLGAVASLWVPWLGVERGECGWTCYVPLAPDTARPTFESLGGPAGRFVAPVGVALAIAAGVLALGCVVAARRPRARRRVLALAVSATVVAVASVAVSVGSVVGHLRHDLVLFDSPGPSTEAASGGLGPGVVLAVACAAIAAVVAAAAGRRGI